MVGVAGDPPSRLLRTIRHPATPPPHTTHARDADVNDHRLAQQLIQDEGLIRHAYQDSLGFWTLGVGRLIDARKGGGITEEEALYLLGNDIKRVWSQLIVRLPWVMLAPEPIQEALANMAFNLGIDGLLKFSRTLSLLQEGQYVAAGAEMLKSTWARQVGARAQRLADKVRGCAQEV